MVFDSYSHLSEVCGHRHISKVAPVLVNLHYNRTKLRQQLAEYPQYDNIHFSAVRLNKTLLAGQHIRLSDPRLRSKVPRMFYTAVTDVIVAYVCYAT